MRLDARWWLAGLLSGLLLAGCVTTTSGPGAPYPKTDTAQKAQEAAQIHTALAQQYMLHGDLKGALKKLKLALKFDDQYVPAHTVLAVLYERIHEYGKAEQQYRRAVYLEPKGGSVNNNLGAYLCRTGKVSASMKYFRKAEKDPFYPTPYVAYGNEGTCQLKLGKTAQAIQNFRMALSMKPDYVDGLYQMAKAYYKKGDAFRASAFIQRLNSLKHSSPQALKLGYLIEMKLGDKEAAQGYLSRLQTQFSKSKQARSLTPKTPNQ